MKKVMLMFLVAALVLIPVLAVAQTGGTGGSPKPGTSGPSGSPSGGPGTMPGSPGAPSGDAPAASPPGGADTLSQHKTKAACEQAGGMWSDAGKACSKKR